MSGERSHHAAVAAYRHRASAQAVAYRHRPSAVGVATFLVGVVGFSTQQSVRSIAGAKAQFGEPVTLKTEARTYDIFGVRSPLITDEMFDTAMRRVSCQITSPTGPPYVVDGEDMSGRVSSDIGVAITRFDGQAGQTTVLCSQTGGDLSTLFYSVTTTRRTLEFILLGTAILGVLLALVGPALITVGLRGRQRIIDDA
jgi:hypothetical protein